MAFTLIQVVTYAQMQYSLYFSKAFNTVSHISLHHKLSQLSLHPLVLFSMKAYLHNHLQISFLPVLSGVP